MEENKKPSNPFAFPAMHSIDGNLITEPKEQFNGMTLRDYFAAKAMQGLIAHYGRIPRYDFEITSESYSIADTMLKQRELC